MEVNEYQEFLDEQPWRPASQPRLCLIRITPTSAITVGGLLGGADVAQDWTRSVQIRPQRPLFPSLSPHSSRQI